MNVSANNYGWMEDSEKRAGSQAFWRAEVKFLSKFSLGKLMCRDPEGGVRARTLTPPSS
jgi:hypothetical protein